MQRIAISNSLDDLREQSNVGTRMAAMYVERLIDLDYQGQLGPMPGLATAWRQTDERTVELELRRGAKFHNGDEMTAEDVAFSFGPQRMFGDTRPTVQGVTLPLRATLTKARVKQLPPEAPPVARRLSSRTTGSSRSTRTTRSFAIRASARR